MWKCFHCTSIGYSHVQTGKVCQDYSDSYEDEGRIIVTACDGHGGKLYVRSDRGSRFASEAAVAVLKKLDVSVLDKTPLPEIEKRIRLEILCEWNDRVERDYAQEPISENELENLDEDQRFKLSMNPEKAYGTTLNAALLAGGKLVCVSIGDGGVFCLKDDVLLGVNTEENEDEPVANITYSLCQEDAYAHILVRVLNCEDADCVLTCTDGTVNPYQNYENFLMSFAIPISNLLKKGREEEVKVFMDKLGREIGIGDDVSVAVILNLEEADGKKTAPVDAPPQEER